MRASVGPIVFCVMAAIFSIGQTFTTVASFDSNTGMAPSGPLLQTSDGNFYGLTFDGGPNVGTLYALTPDGVLTALHTFCSLPGCADGANPSGPLIQLADGELYGTTASGGPQYAGTIFKITLKGSLTTLHTFDYTDSVEPYSGVIQARDGSFYGTTWGGGNYFPGGTVFKMTSDGVLTTLHGFGSGFESPDGSNPIAGLVQGPDGNLYGATRIGGTGLLGTIFKITPDGVLTTLHNFNGNDGSEPKAALVQAGDGDFYGVTSSGGTSSAGTFFKITSQGELTTLYSFPCSQQYCFNGRTPNGPLVLATDGNFYGTTMYGGVDTCDCGTIFKITPAGVLTTLHSFTRAQGGSPWTGLMQARDGSFYGTTSIGGSFNDGTVFRLTIYPTLTVTKSVTGTVASTDGHIYCGNACSYGYLNKEQVTLSALPAAGYSFSGWTGCDNVNGSYCSVTIAQGANVTATFTTANVTLTSLTFKPSYVKGGHLSAGTVTLSGPAPAGGVTVALSSDHPSVAHPPSFVFVSPGASSAGFAVNTFPVRNNTTATITATAGNSQVSGKLTVGMTSLPPSLR
jgi:uncharacterized repeat protein (TIGR03803 family)